MIFGLASSNAPAPAPEAAVVAALSAGQGWAWVPIVMGGGALLILVSIAAALLARHYWRKQTALPLRDLAAAASSISRGERDLIWPLHSNDDDVRSLSRSLHALAIELQSHEQQQGALLAAITAVAEGRLAEVTSATAADDEPPALRALRQMGDRLIAVHQEQARNTWLQQRLLEIAEALRFSRDPSEVATQVVSKLCHQLSAPVGAFYLTEKPDQDPTLRLRSSYAYRRRKTLSQEFKLGEGVVGQAALERQQIVLQGLPDEHLDLVTALGQSRPRSVCVTPFCHEEHVVGVIELGLYRSPTDLELDYLNVVAPALGATFSQLLAVEQQVATLQKSHASTQRLMAQHQTLQAANKELQEGTESLRKSKSQLEEQEAKLRKSIQKLEQENRELSDQKRKLEGDQGMIAGKAEELALASKYKSQFLANMSHELRTPLNSLLLLARWLSENKEGNLTDAQVQSAGVIYSSGKDLLTLIDDILDLSKIEAGCMNISAETVALDNMARALKDSFVHMASDRGLTLSIVVSKRLPKHVVTDPVKLQQILKNLVSNALKFTEKGEIVVRFDPMPAEAAVTRDTLLSGNALAISVSDTGVGVAPAKQAAIFEAFQQADGTTSRKYGGTGLGLSISRQLVNLLEGEIHLESVEGQGSTFTIYLPYELSNASQKAPWEGTAERRLISALLDGGQQQPERLPAGGPKLVPTPTEPASSGGAQNKSVLIIDDDVRFTRTLASHWESVGLKVLVAGTGEQGLAAAKRNRPRAVFLDIQLPGINGWDVLRRLKEDTTVRHIPVHVISGEDCRSEALQRGAVGHVRKPVSKESLKGALERVSRAASRRKHLVIAHPSGQTRTAITKLLTVGDTRITELEDAEALQAAVTTGECDCVVAGVDLWREDGAVLLEQLKQSQPSWPPPIIVYSNDQRPARRLPRDPEVTLTREVRSEAALFDQVMLFLHQPIADLRPAQQEAILKLHDTTSTFVGKRILIVEDDMRSAFALAGLLSERGMKVYKAEDGSKALSLLDHGTEVDLVLMDIMMPVMDGYETMRRIRADQRFSGLPIIALTAKAMREDVDKCLAEGANDYLAKPIDGRELMSLMRHWIHDRRDGASAVEMRETGS